MYNSKVFFFCSLLFVIRRCKKSPDFKIGVIFNRGDGKKFKPEGMPEIYY